MENGTVEVNGRQYKAFNTDVSYETGKFDKIAYVAEELEVSKAAAKSVIEMVMDAIAYEVSINGSSKLPGIGKLLEVNVPERSGVIKTSDDEKPWTKPAHKTIKFKISADGDDWVNNYGDYAPVKIEEGIYGLPVEE